MSTKLEVAKRYAGSRPGFELVIAEDVGIPYFELRMQVLVQREKNIGPIDEFVLGSVKRGIDTVPEVMRFLGLDQLVVEQAIVDLCKTDLLDYQVGTNGNAFHLTELGKNAYQSLVELVPDRLEIKLGFDRLIWQPSSRHERALIRPRDAKSRELSKRELIWMYVCDAQESQKKCESIRPHYTKSGAAVLGQRGSQQHWWRCIFLATGGSGTPVLALGKLCFLLVPDISVGFV